MFGSISHPPNVQYPYPPQLTNKANTSIGVQLIRESIFIGHIVTDEDGSLKIKRTEEFTDSKTYLDTTQAIAAAKAKKG